MRLVAVRERAGYEAVRVGELRRRLDLLARRALLAERDVLGDGAEEEDRLLPDEPDVPAQRLHIHLAQVDAVNEHRARGAGRSTARAAG